MIIIGVITIVTILSQRAVSYPNTAALDIRSSLGASVYPVYDDNNSYELYPNYPSSVSLTPIGASSTPRTTTTKYYYYSYPQQDSYYDDTYYGDTADQGYVPSGCESGTDYSLTTGEACG